MTNQTKQRNVPNAPKKAAPKQILPSSRYYTTNKNNINNNLTNENVIGAEEVNINEMVETVKKYAIGNKPVPYHHPKLNYKAPQMKLPAFVKGGKSRRTRRRSTKRRHTRKH